MSIRFAHLAQFELNIESFNNVKYSDVHCCNYIIIFLSLTVCPSGLSILYAKYDDIDFDIYMDNNLAAVDPHLALEGSNTNITINENNTYHVNKSILGKH